MCVADCAACSARWVRLTHLWGVQAGVRAIRGVGHGLVDGRKWGAALYGVDELRAMWDGGPPVPSALPSRRVTPLPSVAEEPSLVTSRRSRCGRRGVLRLPHQYWIYRCRSSERERVRHYRPNC